MTSRSILVRKVEISRDDFVALLKRVMESQIKMIDLGGYGYGDDTPLGFGWDEVTTIPVTVDGTTLESKITSLSITEVDNFVPERRHGITATVMIVDNPHRGTELRVSMPRFDVEVVQWRKSHSQ